jgi:hypothetical protein
MRSNTILRPWKYLAELQNVDVFSYLCTPKWTLLVHFSLSVVFWFSGNEDGNTSAVDI